MDFLTGKLNGLSLVADNARSHSFDAGPVERGIPPTPLRRTTKSTDSLQPFRRSMKSRWDSDPNAAATGNDQPALPKRPGRGDAPPAPPSRTSACSSSSSPSRMDSIPKAPLRPGRKRNSGMAPPRRVKSKETILEATQNSPTTVVRPGIDDLFGQQLQPCTGLDNKPPRRSVRSVHVVSEGGFSSHNPRRLTAV